MNFELIHVSRRPPWPVWAVMLVLVWLLFVGVLAGFSIYTGKPVQLCLFRYLTRIPCPTCGLTRSALLVLQGCPGKAWLCNPLICSIIALFFAATLARILFARSIKVQLSRTERYLAWILAFTLLLCNWLYIIFCTG
jgi:hypothetical protein